MLPSTLYHHWQMRTFCHLCSSVNTVGYSHRLSLSLSYSFCHLQSLSSLSLPYVLPPLAFLCVCYPFSSAVTSPTFSTSNCVSSQYERGNGIVSITTFHHHPWQIPFLSPQVPTASSVLYQHLFTTHILATLHSLNPISSSPLLQHEFLSVDCLNNGADSRQ